MLPLQTIRSYRRPIKGDQRSPRNTRSFPLIRRNTVAQTFSSLSGGAVKRRDQLVILGTGWAGYRALLDVNIDDYDVTVVSPRNHFLFTPLLTSTTVGTLEFRGVTEPVRTARKRLKYLQASCTKIDPDNQMIYAESIYDQKDEEDKPSFKPAFEIPYDKLVLSVGANAVTFGIPGVEKYCFFLKQLSDARAIRNRILECFERASQPTISESEKSRLLHFVVVGGGPTSVEFAAELHDFLRQDVHKWYPDLETKVQVTLLEAGKKLLSSFDAKLSDYTLMLYKKRKIDVRTEAKVQEVHRHQIVLQDGTSIPFGLAVWSTGVGPTNLVKSLPFAKDRAGRIIVDDHLRVKEPHYPNIMAVGDCATLETEPLPPTAQAAEQEGKYAAKYLNGVKKGSAVEPFRYHNRGMLAYIGGKRALVDTPVAKNGGFFSWILWNAAYITKLVSFKNKIMIPMYWFKSFVFGRDISRF